MVSEDGLRSRREFRLGSGWISASTQEQMGVSRKTCDPVEFELGTWRKWEEALLQSRTGMFDEMPGDYSEREGGSDNEHRRRRRSRERESPGQSREETGHKPMEEIETVADLADESNEAIGERKAKRPLEATFRPPDEVEKN